MEKKEKKKSSFPFPLSQVPQLPLESPVDWPPPPFNACYICIIIFFQKENSSLNTFFFQFPLGQTLQSKGEAVNSHLSRFPFASSSSCKSQDF